MLALMPRELVGNAGAFGRLVEAVERGVDRLLGFGALGLDELRWNAAHDRAGNDRIVDEGDAQHVGTESLGHRNGEVAGGITLAQPEIDDDVLDHDRFSSPRRRMPTNKPFGTSVRKPITTVIRYWPLRLAAALTRVKGRARRPHGRAAKLHGGGSLLLAVRAELLEVGP